MELKEEARIRTSYELALERSASLENQPRATIKNEEWADNSMYDKNFFLIDDKSKHLPDTFELSRAKKREVVKSLDEDNILAVEEMEDLTFPKLPDPDPETFDVKVHFSGPMFDYGGYAKMNRTFIFGLRDLGALVKVHPIESITNVNKRTEDALRMLSKVHMSNKYPKIFAMTVPDIIAHGGRKILYTMMETSNHVHKEYAERLNLADEVWTPTTWCRDVFANSGVCSKIYVMPLGVDTERYRPGLEPIDFKAKLRKFRFLSASGWSYRKGFDVLIRAYLEEFSNLDDVTLILSSRFAGGLSKKSKDRLMNDFQYFRSMVKKTDSELPHIVLHSTYTPEEKMPHLYNSANCFVLISRGEGWGLPYCEAASCGLPIIASDHGGQRDFLNNENSYLVPPSSYFISKTQDPPYKNMAWISHFYENQEFPDYEGESFQLIKKHMRFVFENYSEAKKKAEKLRNLIVEKFDWSHSVNNIYNRLRDICKNIDGRT